MNLNKEKWVRVKTCEVASIIGGGIPTRSILEYFKGKNLWIRPTKIPKDRIRLIYNTKEQITDEAINKSSAKLLPVGNILLTTRATVGEVAIAGKEITTSQFLENFICNPDKIFNWHLAYWLKGNQDLIQLYSFKGDIILDPFLGSGTTAVSALKSKRKFVGYDISQEYIDLAERRLKPFLKQTSLKFTKVEIDEE